MKTMKEKKNYKIGTLLSQLSMNDFLTGKQIAEDLGVSIKTIRTRIAELNLQIGPNGAQIISRPRYGYQIQVNDREKWDAYLKSQELKKELVSGAPEERTAHITLSLLTAADYIKVSDFADELYVSSQLISDSLKDCEKIFGYYNLSIERKPYYGLRLIGREFDKRNCIISSFPDEYRSFLDAYEDDESMVKTVFETLIRTFHAHRIHLAEVSLEKCAAYVYLSIVRYDSGFQITEDDRTGEEMMNDVACTAAREIYQKLAPDISDSEIYYLGVYISAMRSNAASEQQGNLVITPKIGRIVDEIFDAVKSVYGLNFRNDLHLYMMLAKHLMSLDLRIRYHIPLQNSVYLDLRRDFPYAYAIASEAVSVLAGEYQTSIDPSETDWFALIFAAGLRDLRSLRKLNVLVVCQTGTASFWLLKDQIQRSYAEHIDSVRIVTAYEFDLTDLSDIDLIFSTAEIRKHTDIPVLMIDERALFQRSSVIETELMKRRTAVIRRFFREDMFFPCIEGSTKEEVLFQLCKEIAEHRQMPEGFYESLMAREHTRPTDTVPGVALPHPEKPVPEEDIIAAAVLKKPVLWGRYEVQLILLTAMSLKHEEATQLFYDVTSHFINDRKSISTLLRTPSYETFIGLLGAVGLE